MSRGGRTGRGVFSAPQIPPIRVGSIVIAPLTPDRGNPKIVKPRRCIVFRPPPSDPAQRIWVVGVTTDHDEFDPDDLEKYPPNLYVAMPHAADGSSPTTFTEPCAAKLSWFEPFLRPSLKPTRGYLPPAQLRDLLKRLDAYIAKLAVREANRPTK